MKSLVKLQLITIFKSPTPYLLIMVVLPLLYILSSAFLPAFIVLPAIFVIDILTMTFFIFGTALFQAKNSIVFKRLDAVGLTKSKFIFGNAMISILLSLCSVYILIELFATVTGLANIGMGFDNPTELGEQGSYYATKLLVPTSFDGFFVNDLFNTLDDATGMIFSNLLKEASDLLLVDPEKFVSLLTIIRELLDAVPEIVLRPFYDDINTFLDNLAPNGSPHDVDKDSMLAGLDDLIIRIDNGNGPLVNISEEINAISQAMIDSFIKNGNHSPIGIITEILLVGVDEIVGDSFNIPIIGDDAEGSVLFRAKKWYSFYIVNGESTNVFRLPILYSRIAPTITTLFSPNLNMTTYVQATIGAANEPMLYTGIKYFLTFVLTSIVIYSLMLLFVSISNNFEQYSLMSGLGLVVVFIFSGLVLPFTFILSFPAMFAFASLIPTTPIIYELQHLGFQNPNVPILAQPSVNLYGIVLYPMFVSLIVLLISTRMLSSENGKLTKKFNHDKRSLRSSYLNVGINILIIFFIFGGYYTLVNYRVDNPSENESSSYPSNFKVFIPMFLITLYTLLLFINVVYSQGRTMTFYQHKQLLIWVNALALVPFGVVTMIISYTSKVDTNFNKQSTINY